MPAITYFATGGTIASVPAESGALPTLTADDLVASVPGLDEVARVTAVQFSQKPSVNLDFADMIALADECRRAVDAGADGVVVSQGTDTIEETSYALDLLWDRDAPLVVTGAMRHPELAGNDGPANVLAAVTVAAHAQARGLGVLVVMNDEIHLAKFVAKSHSSSPAAFTSPGFGPIGRVTEGRCAIVLRARRDEPLASPQTVRPVACVELGMGDEGRYLEALPGLGYGGLVIAGAGGGHVPYGCAPRLGELSSRFPVVLATRTRAGDVLRETYGYVGGEIDLARRGLILAGCLSPLKAHALLCLAAERDVAAEFATRGYLSTR